MNDECGGEDESGPSTHEFPQLSFQVNGGEVESSSVDFCVPPSLHVTRVENEKGLRSVEFASHHRL